MKILSIAMENFHNQKELAINFSTLVTNIYGANGTGKTTVMDALHFLLYQKDSKGRSNTSVRPYDANGELVHDIVTTVKGTFEDEVGQFCLQVDYRENWTKISGSEERKLTGNTTDYYIDGIPKKAKEYADFISKHFPEPWYTITTSPTTFPGMPWQKQREVLLALIGDIGVDSVVAAYAKVGLSAISEDLHKFSANDLKKKWDKEKKTWAVKLKEIPARIDELRHNLYEGNAEAQRAELDRLIEGNRARAAYYMEKKAAILNGTGADKINLEIMQLEEKLEAIRRAHRENKDKVMAPFNKAHEDICSRIVVNNGQLSVMRQRATEMNKHIREQEQRLDVLRSTWDAVNSEVFTDTACPHCHRPYDADMLKPMEQAFNKSKAGRLEQCNNDGSALAQKLGEDKKEYSQLMQTINELARYEIEEAPKLREANNTKMNEALSRLKPLEETVHPQTKEPFYAIREQLEIARKNLERLKNRDDSQIADIDAHIKTEKDQEAAYMVEMSKVERDTELRERIEVLTKEKKNVMVELEAVERRLFLLNKFIVCKIQLIDQKVNDMFSSVRFRLFEKNIGNEGIKETCELMMHGVPYRNLSFAEQHVAGMDIINTISKFYNMSNPLFIDNRESITSLPEGQGQIINLIVNDADKVLRVEHA